MLHVQEMVVAGEEVTEVEEDRWYLSRLSGGLYTLQTVDYILAWICMEDDGVSTKQHHQRLTRTTQSLFDFTDPSTHQTDVSA